MSDLQPSRELAVARTEAPKRDWRLFSVTLVAGIAAFAILLSMHYMPEIYQKLTALTLLGVAFGFAAYSWTYLGLRDSIGAAGFGVALLTSGLATTDHLLAAWFICVAGAVTSIIVLALRFSEPLGLSPGSNRHTR